MFGGMPCAHTRSMMISQAEAHSKMIPHAQRASQDRGVGQGVNDAWLGVLRSKMMPPAHRAAQDRGRWGRVGTKYTSVREGQGESMRKQLVNTKPTVLEQTKNADKVIKSFGVVELLSNLTLHGQSRTLGSTTPATTAREFERGTCAVDF